MGIIKRNACQRAHCNKNLSGKKSLNINDKPCEDINEQHNIYFIARFSLTQMVSYNKYFKLCSYI